MLNTERKNLLSVIIYFYNYKYPQNLRAVLKSIRDQSIDVEIVLSEQGLCKESIYKKIAEEYNAKYILSKPDFDGEKEIFNIGRVRNVGALLSTGRYLYFSDADILINNRNYFSTILEKSALNNNYNWYRPSMYRLSEETYNEFINDYLEDKKIDIPDLSDICIVDYDKSTRTIKPISEGECNETILNQAFVCTKKEFDLVNQKDFDPSKNEEFIWKPRFHYGGTFCNFSDFLEVAGFCESYYNWGLEDEDFHSKLKAKSSAEKIDSIVPIKSIIHFEHNHKYNDHIYKENVNVFERRQSIGIDEVIKTDINNEKSFIGSYIHGNKSAMESLLITDL